MNDRIKVMASFFSSHWNSTEAGLPG